MHVLLILAAVGSAVSAPDGLSPFNARSFSSTAGLVPPAVDTRSFTGTSGFAAPVTSGFAPQASGFSPTAGRFAAPVTSGFAPQASGFSSPTAGRFAAPATSGFAPQVSSFSSPTVGRFAEPVPISRTINLDSVFVPQGGVASAPSGFGRTGQPDISVVERREYLNDNGEFASSFRGSDGQTFSETGKLHPTNDHLDNVVVKEGSYSYTSPEGVPVSVTYTADEYGFHPVSSNIPQPVAPIVPTF